VDGSFRECPVIVPDLDARQNARQLSGDARRKFEEAQRTSAEEQILILRHAEQEGFMKRPDVQRSLIRYVARRYMRQEGLHSEVTDAEARSYYEENRSSFGIPEKRIARQILFGVPEGAGDVEFDAAYGEAMEFVDRNGPRMNPVEFGKSAAKISDDPRSAQKAGIIAATAHRGDERSVSPAVAEALFALEERGEMTQPVRSSEGWHVLVLAQRIDGVQRDFDDVSALVKKRIREEQRKAFIRELETEASGD
jgi:parvulin-like peptidyl-prolyl isomerase